MSQALDAKKPCLVFDLDDTLFLECDYVRSGFAVVGEWAQRNLGIAGFSNRAWACFKAGHRGRIFDIVLKQIGCDPAPHIIQAMVSVYRTHRPQITILPDAAECLAFFRDTALLALITDGPPESQSQKVSALQLEPLFQMIVFTGTWGSTFSKPHVRAFHTVQTRLKPSDRRFIYVGDNPVKDFVTPAALGWQTVRIRRPEGLYARCEARPGEAAAVEFADLTRLRDFVCAPAAIETS
jgi:putative hydrolase of the HAD superfamily